MSRSFLLSVANSVAQRPCPPPHTNAPPPLPGQGALYKMMNPPGTPPPKEVPLYHALFECIRGGFSFGGGGDRTEPFRPRCSSPASSPNRAGVGVVGVNTHLQQCSLGVACGGRLVFSTSSCWSTHTNQRLPHVLHCLCRERQPAWWSSPFPPPPPAIPAYCHLSTAPVPLPECLQATYQAKKFHAAPKTQGDRRRGGYWLKFFCVSDNECAQAENPHADG